MPLQRYGVLKGSVVDRRLATGGNPHYQVKVVDDQHVWRIAINVQSKDKSQVEYASIDRFNHPILEQVEKFDQGFTMLPSQGRQGLDFIRGNLVDPKSFVPLPFDLPGPDNDLNEKLEQYVQRAMGATDATIYAFGEAWGPESKRDKIFGFLPGQGIHDIHMNQGNGDPHKKDNGVWQDGGLLFHFPSTHQWVAIFLKFQTQSWHTDDVTGDPLSSNGPEDHEAAVRIVAALVNDIHPEEQESVTLLNVTPEAIDLTGWVLQDAGKHRKTLSGKLPPGQMVIIQVRPELQLGNKGGIITLLNPKGLRVDGVQYTKEMAKRSGWTIKF